MLRVSYSKIGRGDPAMSVYVGIDGTSLLSGAMSQDRFAFSSARQGARRSQGQKSASWPAVPALRVLGWPAIILRRRKG